MQTAPVLFPLSRSIAAHRLFLEGGAIMDGAPLRLGEVVVGGAPTALAGLLLLHRLEVRARRTGEQ